MTTLQGDLLATCPPGDGPQAINHGAPTERITLGPGCWVDVVRDWLLGADALFAELAAGVMWRQRRRRMWDRMVDEPRLTCWCAADQALPHPALAELRREIGGRYGVQFGAVGLNYYRDGADSVAPHRDRDLRHLDDTVVAIVTCGARRPFLIHPRRGGSSVDIRPGSGDLLVMGGACQRHWEHGVPKVAASGPRISVSLRCARAPA